MQLLRTLCIILPFVLTMSATAQDADTDNDTVPAHPDMVRVEGGTFQMGSAKGHQDELPVHSVTLSDFLIDRTPVTNKQFAAFVEDTGYVTQAEHDGYAWGFLEGDTDFRQIAGAHWRQPEGTGTTIDERMDHPVVCVTWHDAQAYAAWAEKRLPTEAEWEYAARSGGGQQVGADPAKQASADKTTDDASFIKANVWMGHWPQERHRIAGFFSTTPVEHFQPNDLGVHDMIGNVWEWTSDWYDPDYYTRSPSTDPVGPESGQYRVARGGSWFCNPEYCAAYNSHYRGASPPTHAFNNVGFRCAADAPSTPKDRSRATHSSQETIE